MFTVTRISIKLQQFLIVFFCIFARRDRHIGLYRRTHGRKKKLCFICSIINRPIHVQQQKSRIYLHMTKKQNKILTITSTPALVCDHERYMRVHSGRKVFRSVRFIVYGNVIENSNHKPLRSEGLRTCFMSLFLSSINRFQRQASRVALVISALSTRCIRQ